VDGLREGQGGAAVLIKDEGVYTPVGEAAGAVQAEQDASRRLMDNAVLKAFLKVRGLLYLV
tara:strand:+ start:353 stop:535 length:183 start_codon:yes stop_codon:yes gene_type:complete